MTTTIHSNGGGRVLPLSTLFETLETHPLERAMFEGLMISEREDGTTTFFGNFLTYSHVFRIETDEPDLIERLTAAIEANMRRPDYLSQPTRAAAIAARLEEFRENVQRAQERREAEARRVLGITA